MRPPTSRPEPQDPMPRVTISPSHRMTLFGPRIAVDTRGCKWNPSGMFWARWEATAVL
jgi:hypothetical protein